MAALSKGSSRPESQIEFHGSKQIERWQLWAGPSTTTNCPGLNRWEVRTGISDEEWVEVLSSRLSSSNGKGNGRWSAVNGLESALVGDLSTLADGEFVRLAEATDRQ